MPQLTRPMQLRLPARVVRSIDRLAAHASISRSEFIRALLDEEGAGPEDSMRGPTATVTVRLRPEQEAEAARLAEQEGLPVQTALARRIVRAYERRVTT